MSFEILDLSAGRRLIWHDADRAGVLWVDIRREVAPSVVANDCLLPLSSGGNWKLVLFDPPHGRFNDANIGMAQRYGSLPHDDIRALIAAAGAEAWRVTRPGCLLAFKWSNMGFSLKRAMGLLSEWWEPIFGHAFRPQGMAKSTTSWTVLERRETRREVMALDGL